MDSSGAACPRWRHRSTVMRRFINEDITGFMVSTGIVKQSEVGWRARLRRWRAFWPSTRSGRPRAPDTGTGTLVASVEDAVRLGVDCVKLLLPWNVERCREGALLPAHRHGRLRGLQVAHAGDGGAGVPRRHRARPRSSRPSWRWRASPMTSAPTSSRSPSPDRTRPRSSVPNSTSPIVVAGGPLSGDAKSTLEGRHGRDLCRCAGRGRRPQGVAAATR